MTKDVEVNVTISPETYARTISELEELNRHAYVFTKLLKRSWLLRLIFGVNLKKLEIDTEVSRDQV